MCSARPEESLTDQLGEAGPWNERLPHFRLEFTPSRGAELQSEYFVPRATRRRRSRRCAREPARLAPVLQVGRDPHDRGRQLWLSGAYGDGRVGLPLHLAAGRPAVYAVLPAIEAALLPFGARPHWGKCFALTAADLRAAYPRLGDFVELGDAVDPSGKFGNAFLERYLG